MAGCCGGGDERCFFQVSKRNFLKSEQPLAFKEELCSKETGLFNRSTLSIFVLIAILFIVCFTKYNALYSLKIIPYAINPLAPEFSFKF